MELKTRSGEVIFALQGAKTTLEVVNAAIKAKRSLRNADLRNADLRGAILRGAVLRNADLSGADLSNVDLRNADLRGAILRDAVLHNAVLRFAVLHNADLRGAVLSGAVLSGAVLSGAVLYGRKVHAMCVYSGLYFYEVWAVLFEDGSRWVRMGCLWHSLEEWDRIGIRDRNLFEFPNDGSERCVERIAAFEFAKAAVLRMKLPVKEESNAVSCR